MAVEYGTAGPDTLTGTGTADFLYGYAGDDYLYGLEGKDVLYGGDGNDRMYGGDGDDQMSGGLGADYMAGGLGNDTYFVDNVGDVVYELAGEGIDTVVSSLAGYTLRANVENLLLATGTANLNGNGNELNNAIRGNDGNNSLSGYAGNDSIVGGGGNDIINPGTGHEYVDGGTGIDLITYRVGATHGVTVDLAINANSQVTFDYGGGVKDTLTVKNVENAEGTAFNDSLLGDAGANKFFAGEGDDFLRGRAGNDDLTGGSGADTFRFEGTATNGQDIIRTFQSGTDHLQFAIADGYTANFTTVATGTGHDAVGSSAQFVYNVQLHQLYFDADGSGAGAAVLLATVLGDTVQSTDIQLI